MNDNEPNRPVNNNLPEQDNTTTQPVVINEPTRTVVLTEEETVVIEKAPELDIIPANRPRKVYGGMWGPPELVALGVSILFLLGAVLFYIIFVKPSYEELEANKSERNRLETELISARAKYGNITNTETEVARLVSSVDDFEANFLPVAINGRTALYQRVNSLIIGNGLVNTNGPTYAPLEVAEPSQSEQSEEERGRERFRSLFPGVYVSMTVEGSYQNLRRFIREVETGREFVIISSVELAPSESTTGNAATSPDTGIVTIDPVTGMQMQAQPQPQTQRGRTQGERVALRLEMAAYFRRPNSAVPVEEVQ